MNGKLIFLNGVTSSGKSSVSDCIKEMCGEPVYLFSNDLFHCMVSYEAYSKHENAFWHLVADTITAQYHAAHGCVKAGFNVVIDGMLLDLPEYVERFGRRNLELLTDIFADCDFTLVDLTCPPYELRRRNLMRGNRGVNQSDEQLAMMTKDYRADLTFDTMTVMPDEAAREILEYCGLPGGDVLHSREHTAHIRRRFLRKTLENLHAHVSYVAVTDETSCPMYISLNADSLDRASEILTSHGYERQSGTRLVRVDKAGHIREVVKLGDEIVSPTDYLGKTVKITIDRPIGSCHPTHTDMVYGVNYGYVDGGIVMPDGEEADAYLLGVDEAVSEYTGVVVAVIHRLNDTEDKSVVAPAGKSISRERIIRDTYFCERYFDIAIYTDSFITEL